MKDQHGCDKLSKSEMLKVIELEFESYLPKLNSSLIKFLLVLKSVFERPRQHVHELKVWKCFKVPSFNFSENFCSLWTQTWGVNFLSLPMNMYKYIAYVDGTSIFDIFSYQSKVHALKYEIINKDFS